ncbi:MAG: hypothetical protein A2474_00295 [Elusimicrobia bacterium RIFOXYC2_FULL_34_12]|nr:MAG: hypothetical protein A2474_00295 [Elusimicrobia bacterium RIFOXYC2_FULL_34_12]OGS37929.1 MAG: hypothetical protein A2551_00500 [Elusimicrobia bacterium RIFOXYD2_FULL_34_30]
MKKYNKSCIIIFIKYPEAGKVKTRISYVIGQKITVELYRSFIIDTLKSLDGINIHKYIFFLPSNSKNKFVRWLGDRYIYIPQYGRDLGNRIEFAFRNVFKLDYNKVVLIGSDSPDLPVNLVKKAFIKLDNNDSVIGPSLDGGYYLIGFNFKGFVPDIFNKVKWSTNTVFSDTMNIFKRNNAKIYILPKWYDIDNVSDLKYLYEINKNTGFRNSETMKFISENYTNIFGN